MTDLSNSELKKRIVELEKELELTRDATIRFNALFNNSPIGIAYHRMIYDESGNPVDFLYLSANANFKDFTGQDPTGRLVTEVFPGIENDPNFDWIKTCAEVAKTGETVRFQQYLPPVDRWYDIVVFQEKVDHFVVSFLETTEQKKLEMDLHQSRKLEAIGKLSGGIAHDFNNMLGGILGSAEMLSKYIPDQDVPQKLLQTITISATRAAELTQQLLAFSRHNKPSSSLIDLHNVVNDSLLLLRNTVDKRINITVKLDSKVSTIMGDPAQLQSVFLNLGINAAQAMQSGGTLTIASKAVELNEIYCSTSTYKIEPGHYINIEYSDTGCGIAQDILQNIFDPFFTTKDQNEGTGLGLSSALGTVVQHKGAISVYSEEGNGSTFQLYFPLKKDISNESYEILQPVKGTGSIMVVDDEKVMRVTAEAILNDLGYDVLLAENGKQALDLYREEKEKVDLVLLDMIMPVMGGRDCFYELRKFDQNVTVVVTSGFSLEHEIKELQEDGLDGFIRKPYLSTELSHVIHNCLKNK